MDLDRVIYSITAEDIQNVAAEELGRRLTESEIKLVENKLADNIAWFEAISDTIRTLNIE